MIETAQPVLELKGITKTFGPIVANKDIELKIAAGTIHGIVGENGAGKSTLMNIIYGLHAPDQGEIWVKGKRVQMRSSADAIAQGIGMVHQHFMLVPTFTVLENVMLGTEGGMLLDKGEKALTQRLDDLARDFGLSVDKDALIQDLPVGVRQRVEVIKALKTGADILILDEPTGVLTPQEAENLFAVLRDMRARGVTILLITHKLDEIMAITDNVTIMHRGQSVGQRETAKTSKQELAELMVGRPVLLSVDAGLAKPSQVLLEVRDLTYHDQQGIKRLDGVNFTLRAGEILGIAGVSGNGQSELLELLSGMLPLQEGQVQVFDQRLEKQSNVNPHFMRALGVGHIPEDRHQHGLVLNFTMRENAILGFQDRKQTGQSIIMDQQGIHQHCQALMDQYDVRPANPALYGANFSGGNQQKVVIAREVEEAPRILLVGQPTRGVDVGAIEFIHKQLIALRDKGCAILLVSVELDEIMGLSNRIMVMNQGSCVGIVERDQTDVTQLGLMMAGVKQDKQEEAN